MLNKIGYLYRGSLILQAEVLLTLRTEDFCDLKSVEGDMKQTFFFNHDKQLGQLLLTFF
jgi:hypothetical protein